ncbi:MAG: CRISPR-associated endonuclease Cas1 [Lachnospirales bacterium]
MSYLYITENGATMNINGGYFEVNYKNGLVHKIPKETLENVVFFGNISITTPCTKELLKRGIPVSYFSANGAYYGRLESTSHKNIGRLKKQIYLSDDNIFAFKMAKQFIKAKINNQLVLLRRYSRNYCVDLKDELDSLKIYKDKIQCVLDSNELIGYEGNAAKKYFLGISKIIKPDFAFNGRNRMPPKDPFNSLISFGYTLLMHEIYGEIENKGLTPYCGFLHKDHERHPTLASDLMEEWRAVIVDSTVLSLIQGNEISIDEFDVDSETGGVLLSNNAMKVFIKKYENKMRSENTYLGYKSTYRKCLWHQVYVLVKAIEENNPLLYEPITIR